MSKLSTLLLAAATIGAISAETNFAMDDTRSRPREDKPKTKHDLDAIEKARVKRERKARKIR